LKANLLELAERGKIDLSNQISQKKMFGSEDFENSKVEILQGNILDNRAFEYELSLEKFEKVVSPLLADYLCLEDVKNVDRMGFEKTENIIYPILDVLCKAERKLGKKPEIDAVLLNGGMTKFYSIPKRLKKLFGFSPIEIMDPDNLLQEELQFIIIFSTREKDQKLY